MSFMVSKDNIVFGFMDKDRKDFLKVKHEEAQRLIDKETGLIKTDLVERIKCPVCKVDDSRNVFKKAGFSFVSCNHCGLLHVNPQLKVEVQDDIYKSSKMANYWIKLQSKSSESDWNAVTKYKPGLKELDILCPNKGKLLDVGCSIGQFLELAQADGWECEGLELNKDAANIAREKGFKINDKHKIEDSSYENNSFDCISLWGVFEHLTEPNEMLQSIHKLLKESGLALFFVPNGHSLIIRLSRENNSTVSGRAHLWYFTPKTIKKILENNGFKVEKTFTILPQIHEIQHFLQYNTLYKESELEGENEFTIDEDLKKVMEKYITKNNLGYKMITIARKI